MLVNLFTRKPMVPFENGERLVRTPLFTTQNLLDTAGWGLAVIGASRFLITTHQAHSLIVEKRQTQWFISAEFDTHIQELNALLFSEKTPSCPCS